MLRGLLVRLLLAGAVHAQRVENDQQVFYGLAYRQCEQGLFDERESPSDGRRLLRQSTRGAACQDEHVGVSLNASCCCYADMGRSDLQASCPVEYDPIRSAIGGGDFGFNMTAGLTIEVWVKPAVLEPYVPGGTTSSMILALSAEAAAADCAGGGSFALRQTSRGCVILEANTAAGCLTLPQNRLPLLNLLLASLLFRLSLCLLFRLSSCLLFHFSSSLLLSLCYSPLLCPL